MYMRSKGALMRDHNNEDNGVGHPVYSNHWSHSQQRWALQRCTESEIFDTDSAPASAEWTPTPKYFKVLDSDSCLNSKVIYLKAVAIDQRWAESHFSDSDSAPAPHFKTPVPAPTLKNFETSTPIPNNTPKTSQVTDIKKVLSILPHEEK